MADSNDEDGTASKAKVHEKVTQYEKQHQEARSTVGYLFADQREIYFTKFELFSGLLVKIASFLLLLGYLIWSVAVSAPPDTVLEFNWRLARAAFLLALVTAALAAFPDRVTARRQALRHHRLVMRERFEADAARRQTAAEDGLRGAADVAGSALDSLQEHLPIVPSSRDSK